MYLTVRRWGRGRRHWREERCALCRDRRRRRLLGLLRGRARVSLVRQQIEEVGERKEEEGKGGQDAHQRSWTR